jgi:hypothetical protein
MSDEAPERIWVDPTNNDGSGVWFIAGTRPRLARQDVEYVRADLHSLPGEVVERLRARVVVYEGNQAIGHMMDYMLLRDILAAIGEKP